MLVDKLVYLLHDYIICECRCEESMHHEFLHADVFADDMGCVVRGHVRR